MSLVEGQKKTPEENSKQDHDNTSLFGIVFANESALNAITGSREKFPEGSILVREKPSANAVNKPERLAVMIKREAGYNPDGGDWQFLLSDGSMKKIQLDQKKGECLDCHKSQQVSDFVFPLVRVRPQ